jgi:hypothetical protein
MCPIERAKELQRWVIISIKYAEIREGGQSTYIDAKGMENALRLTARV